MQKKRQLGNYSQLPFFVLVLEKTKLRCIYGLLSITLIIYL